MLEENVCLDKALEEFCHRHSHWSAFAAKFPNDPEHAFLTTVKNMGRWILHNQLTGSTYRIADWPDRDSSKKNVDATCVDNDGHKLAIEHTLIQPFENEKADAAVFLQTLGTLENNPALSQAGYMYLASQPVGSIPKV
jgi:hypothetical protein